MILVEGGDFGLKVKAEDIDWEAYRKPNEKAVTDFGNTPIVKGTETRHSLIQRGKMVMYRKFIGILVFMITGGLFTGTVYSADIKIASVDMQKAVNECNAGKEAKKGLTQETEKFQHLIAEKQKELQKMKESLEKQGLILSPETREVSEKELQAKVRDFQRWGEDHQNELKQKQIDTERNISIGLIKVVQEIGANEGYTLILQKNENIVLFASKPTDITDQVIKAYNAQKK